MREIDSKEMFERYYEDLVKDDRNIVNGANDFAVLISPIDSTLAIFAISDNEEDNIRNTSRLEQYINDIKKKNLTLSSEHDELQPRKSDDGHWITGSVLQLAVETESGNRDYADTIEKCCAAIESAKAIGIKARADSLLFISPRLEWQITTRGEFYLNLRVKTGSLDLVDKKKDCIPKDLRNICRNWKQKSKLAKFVIGNGEDSTLQIHPCKNRKEYVEDDYLDLINDITQISQDMFTADWQSDDYIKSSFHNRTRSVSYSDIVDKQYKSPFDEIAALDLDILKRDPAEEDSTTLSSTPTENNTPPQSHPENNQTVGIEETPIKVKDVDVTYNIKRLETMGIDEVFFHRLLK